MTKTACLSRDLLKFLRGCDAEDLNVLVDYLTDNGRGRLALSTESKEALMSARARGARGAYSAADVERMVTELERFGGNSLVNFFRGGAGVAYEEIVKDVRDHVGAAPEVGETVESMELQVLARMLERAWEKMSAEERRVVRSVAGLAAASTATGAAVVQTFRKGGVGSFSLTLLIAHRLALQMTGQGFALATLNVGIARTVAALAGPIGWIVTGAWTAFELASPAYRVTLPCVVHIAYMRQKRTARICRKCMAPNPTDVVACRECGAKLPAPRA